jgi:hypothetical protein
MEMEFVGMAAAGMASVAMTSGNLELNFPANSLAISDITL